jgi:DNA uptake protein ComE-like DNA-binding protein
MKRSSSKGRSKAKPKAKPKGLLDANEATFEQLRGVGLSVTQATRLIAYRERAEGFDTVDDMDTIPGFPPDQLEELKAKLTA